MSYLLLIIIDMKESKEQIEEVAYICELEHGLKFCRHEAVKDTIQGKIFSCLIDKYKYCMFIQAIIADAEDIVPELWTIKYGKIVRTMLDEGYHIDDILLAILDDKFKDLV